MVSALTRLLLITCVILPFNGAEKLRKALDRKDVEYEKVKKTSQINYCGLKLHIPQSAATTESHPD